MTDFPDRLFRNSDTTRCRIILPEYKDSRIQEAKQALRNAGVQLVHPEPEMARCPELLEFIKRRKFTYHWTPEMLETYLADPLNLSVVLTALGKADGVVAGCTCHRSVVLRTALRNIGLQRSRKFCFSSTLMVHAEKQQALTFADCSIVPEPKPAELAVIAGESAEWHHFFTGEVPTVAFISFSTSGDIQHYRVERVLEAQRLFKKKYSKIRQMGEVQIDAALSPDSARIKLKSKAPEKPANVLIFPNMDAGNAAYKTAELLGGFQAVGPMIHSLNRPVNLVSRACSAQDIYNTGMMTVLEATKYANL